MGEYSWGAVAGGGGGGNVASGRTAVNLLLVSVAGQESYTVPAGKQLEGSALAVLTSNVVLTINGVRAAVFDAPGAAVAPKPIRANPGDVISVGQFAATSGLSLSGFLYDV